MRLTTVVVMVALVGCAGNQSAFPMPPVFSPVEDAPITVGHPGYVAPEPERSPYKRVLPETPDTRRGPGLWAVKPPDDGGEFVLVLGVPVRPATVNAEARTVATICADSINRAAGAVGRSTFPQSMPEQARRCAAARMYWQCADHWSRVWRQARQEVVRSDKAMEDAWRETLATATAMVKAECGFRPSDAFEEWLRPIAQEWGRANGLRD